MARAALSLAFSGLSGSLGDLTIVQLPDGPLVRPRRYRPRTLTPAQAERAKSMQWIGQAWRDLDDETYAAWQAYAEARKWRNPATGAIVTPKPFPLFTALALKVRQIDPAFDLTGFLPPARPFFGDSVVVVAQASLPANVEFAGTEARATSEALGFTADRANAPGVVTELLVQPLANARRAVYRDKYVSRGFLAFEGAETVEVALAPGAWAVAYRFVLAATGQETELVPLGVSAVG